MKVRNHIITVGLVVMFSILAPVTGSATYVIGPEDVLDIRFWQDNSLDAVVKVRQDGMISLDIIGEIEAAGLSASELEKQIVRQLSRYNKAISQAVVRVIEYGYQKVYIAGQVVSPGKYTFEEIPDLWTLINEAGGIAEFGDLTRVLIIRGGDRAGELEIVDVATMVSEGRLAELPEIGAGDTIEVPRTRAGLPSRSLSEQPETRNIFYVNGAVLTPGALTLESSIDVLDAISLAGGPAENADLENVKVISKDGPQTQVVKINLKKYTEKGIPRRYIVQPEDAIIIPAKSRGFMGVSSLTEWAAVLGAVSTLVILYDALTRDDR